MFPKTEMPTCYNYVEAVMQINSETTSVTFTGHAAQDDSAG
jgi:hypothetical protein